LRTFCFAWWQRSILLSQRMEPLRTFVLLIAVKTWLCGAWHHGHLPPGPLTASFRSKSRFSTFSDFATFFWKGVGYSHHLKKKSQSLCTGLSGVVYHRLKLPNFEFEHLKPLHEKVRSSQQIEIFGCKCPIMNITFCFFLTNVDTLDATWSPRDLRLSSCRRGGARDHFGSIHTHVRESWQQVQWTDARDWSTQTIVCGQCIHTYHHPSTSTHTHLTPLVCFDGFWVKSTSPSTLDCG
jgi:hypothetical protein